ncbi:MAG: hypothetical protein K2K13_05585 [Clostridiales bacterium]|nr:hypothetical protein [Clostridiales bacterium]
MFDFIKKLFGIEKDRKTEEPSNVVNINETKIKPTSNENHGESNGCTLEQLQEKIENLPYYDEWHDKPLYSAYTHKLFKTPIENGGLGVPHAKELLSSWCMDVVYRSISRHGPYMNYGKFSGKKIQNYLFVYIQQYAKHVNKKFNVECLKAVENAICGEYLSNDIIEDEQSFLYDARFYESNDPFYKLSTAIRLSNNEFLDEFGLYKKDTDGNATDEFITPWDVADMFEKADIVDFVNYCQTRTPPEWTIYHMQGTTTIQANSEAMALKRFSERYPDAIVTKIICN